MATSLLVMEVSMPARLSCFMLVGALLAVPLQAKDKNKPTLPDFVLRASTVLVVVDPDAGEPLDEPNANAAARDNVEKALMEWGRLRPMMDGAQTDLVIVVRTGSGRSMRPTIKGGPIDQRTGVGQETDSSIRIGGQQGHGPPLTQSGQQNTGPHISNEIGASDDSFAVYRGGVDYPLDAPAVWRYVAKNCLRPPKMSAVEEFRKAMVEAEKPQQNKKP
jgi:hypothetical protein